MNDIDLMVLRFHTATDRERNNIFKIIRGIYLPKYYYKRNGYAKRFWSYLDSEYDLQVFRCMLKWNPDKGVLFTTYLYTYATLKPFSAVNEKVIMKSRREPTFTELFWDEDLE